MTATLRDDHPRERLHFPPFSDAHKRWIADGGKGWHGCVRHFDAGYPA
jgi:hypothetical protein